ncbi:MAG: hypothetical protein MPJ22_12250, partial [Pirellulales bacterium]|nr:hypothetical protein [Pirellulales bacterium]
YRPGAVCKASHQPDLGGKGTANYKSVGMISIHASLLLPACGQPVPHNLKTKNSVRPKLKHKNT